MKKILALFISIIFLSSACVYAKSSKNDMPSIKMNGSKFTLYYSAKCTEISGQINEYYKKNEGYTIWTELIGLHHYPASFYPIEHAQEFKAYLDEGGIPNELEINDKDNSAVLDFVVINDKRLPIVMEFNVFKYVKSPVCGSLGLQYAKRYLINNALEVNSAKKEFKKTRKKYIKQLKKLEVPELVTASIDKGVYIESSEQKKEEEVKVEEQVNEVSDNQAEQENFKEEESAVSKEKVNESVDEASENSEETKNEVENIDLESKVVTEKSEEVSEDKPELRQVDEKVSSDEKPVKEDKKSKAEKKKEQEVSEESVQIDDEKTEIKSIKKQKKDKKKEKKKQQKNKKEKTKKSKNTPDD